MLRRIAFLTVLFCCGLLHAETITVFAALSLKDVLNDVAKHYSTDTQDQVNFIFGNSVTLAELLAQGTSADLFVSAAAKPVDTLVTDGLADPVTRTTVATNRLVLVVPANSKNPPARFEDLADPRFARVAIGDPETVAMGKYAMQTFSYFHLDSALAPRLVQLRNTQEVLIYVSLGQAEAGVVYVTDAAQARGSITIAASAPDEAHDPIIYPAVILKAGKTAAAAARFLTYLQSDTARGILTTHGFGIPPATTRPG
jgi:molybdate transport system substrate-binding protein